MEKKDLIDLAASYVENSADNIGIAGRFGSLITELSLTPDRQEYSGVYEYCSMCGAN